MTYDETLIIEAIHRPEGEQGSEAVGWEIDLRFTPEDSEGHWVGASDAALRMIVGNTIAQALIADRDGKLAQIERMITFRRAEWSDEGHTPDEIEAMVTEEREELERR